MSTQPPTPSTPSPNSSTNVQRIAIDGMPSRLQILMWLGSTAIGIVIAITGFGAVYLNKSLEATESRLSNTVRDTMSPVNEKESQLRFIVGFLVEKNTAFTPEEKKIFSELLKKINYEDFNDLLRKIPEQAKREPLDELIKSHRVEEVRRVTGLVWGNGDPAQIRYIRSKDPSLDLRNVDFYTTDDDPCESKNLDALLGTPNVSAKVCDSHMNSTRHLELIVVQPPERPQTF